MSSLRAHNTVSGLLPAIQTIHLHLLHFCKVDGTVHLLSLKASRLNVAIVDSLTEDLLTDG